jgi:hypothetical protein
VKLKATNKYGIGWLTTEKAQEVDLDPRSFGTFASRGGQGSLNR